jgi:uncharacterized protein YbjT (DUF2867 family)
VRIVVFGGSGVVGRHVVTTASSLGHDAVAASRTTGVDLTTGEGLDEVLAGAAAAVDVSNVATIRRRPALEFFESTSKHLQAAASRAGVEHVVVLSIVGIDRLRALGYYDAKVTHERLHLDGPVAATVVRATQFHEFPGQVVARSTAGPVAFVPSMTVQTVAARSVAEVLVETATGAPWRGRALDVAGPGPAVSLPSLATATLARSGSRTKVVAVPLVGPPRRASTDGSLLPAADARLVGPTFAEWLDGPDGP